ncbi:hypothetical protein Tco_0868126 [Tanacetum coccineum]
MENVNPFVKSLTCELSCLEGEPEFVMLFKKEELVKEIEEEFEEEEEEDDLEYFNTFPIRDELDYHEYLLKNPLPSWIRVKIMNDGLESRKKQSNPKDVSSAIDPYLGGMVLGKPFVKESKLIYDKEEGTIIKGGEEKRESYVTQKRMTHYSDCLKLGLEYKRDEGVIKTIQFLNGRSSMRGEGVT